MNQIILGITGDRYVGKSTAIEYLSRQLGFVKGHPFNVGKEMLHAYYVYVGIPSYEAWDMLIGDKKDVPCDKLPNNATSRSFMEELGMFLGKNMGPDWTAGAEIVKHSMTNNLRLVFDSVVYESDWLREKYPQTKIIRIEGPQRSKEEIVAQNTSKHQKEIKVDGILYNIGTKQDLCTRLNNLLYELWPDEFEPLQ